MRQKTLPIVCAVFLVVAMTVQFFVSYQREKADLMKQMEYKMESAQKDFLFEIYDMHEATDEITEFFPEFDGNRNELYALLETVLGHYPSLYCCYVAFPPESSPRWGRWSCPTAFRVTKDSIITYDAKETIPYEERDWYIGALNSNDEGYWSLPYNDGTHADPVFTYAQKVYDSHDRLVGVAGADYTLAWTAQLLEEIKPYDDAECELFSSDGTLIVGCGHTTKHTHDRIVFEKVLSPTNMRLVITVPKCHIRNEIAGISLITLAVLLAGLLTIGLLMRHIRKEHDAFVRIETTNKLMEKEMQIAHDIQMGMLPSKGEGDPKNLQIFRGSPGERLKVKGEGDPKNLQIFRGSPGEREDIDLQATLIPMREVGGDLYDFHREGDKLWFIIGDVSGKGVPAAMFMSAAVNLFRAAGSQSTSPREIMQKMNIVLSENNPSLTFVTAFIGRLHVPTGELLYCNAGHCEPLLVESQKSKVESLPLVPNIPLGIVESQKSKVESLPLVPNIPLGFDGKFKFVEQGCMLSQDETLVLYTDGVTEARNRAHQMLGMKRWCSIVESQKSKVESQKSQVESLLDEVKTFIGEAEQADDITLMTIRKTSPVEPLTLRVENRIDHLPELRKALHDFGLSAGLEARALKKTEVAIEEMIVNIVNYSQAEWMEVEVESRKSKVESLNAKGLVVTLRDNGVEFDPTKQAEVDTEKVTAERQIGGLGIALLRKIADDVNYERRDGINELTILKNL